MSVPPGIPDADGDARRNGPADTATLRRAAARRKAG
jgi:hypothetical protein